MEECEMKVCNSDLCEVVAYLLTYVNVPQSMYKHALLSNKFMIAIKIGLPDNVCGGVAWEIANKLHNSSTIKLSKMKG
jgi:hypothetical protein